MCSVPKGNQHHGAAHVSRGGGEGNARESHMTSGQQNMLDVQLLSVSTRVPGRYTQRRHSQSRGNDRPERVVLLTDWGSALVSPHQAFQLESSALFMLAVTSSDLPTPWPQLHTQGGFL